MEHSRDTGTRKVYSPSVLSQVPNGFNLAWMNQAGSRIAAANVGQWTGPYWMLLPHCPHHRLAPSESYVSIAPSTAPPSELRGLVPQDLVQGHPIDPL